MFTSTIIVVSCPLCTLWCALRRSSSSVLKSSRTCLAPNAASGPQLDSLHLCMVRRKQSVDEKNTPFFTLDLDVALRNLKVPRITLRIEQGKPFKRPSSPHVSAFLADSGQLHYTTKEASLASRFEAWLARESCNVQCQHWFHHQPHQLQCSKEIEFKNAFKLYSISWCLRMAAQHRCPKAPLN